LLLASFAVTGNLAPVSIADSVLHHAETKYPREGRTSDDRSVARWCKTTGSPASTSTSIEGDRYETLAICRSLALARAAFEVAVEEKPTGRFMIRSRTRVVKRHPEGDW